MSKLDFRIYHLIFTISVIILFVFLLKGISRTSLPPPTQLPSIERTKWSDTKLTLKPIKNYKDTLFNLTFKYVIEPQPCQDADLLAVIIVTSYYGNVEARSAMRRSYSNQELQELRLKRVFLLGESPNDVYTTQEAIRAESGRFADLVQGNFMESYRNLTYKHTMGLKWASEKCSSAKYVIKMDDDIVVNVERVVSLLNSLNLPQNLLAGYVFRKMVPIREPANKWYVTKEEYDYNTYPSFISGWFYVTTPKIAGKFFLLSHHFKYFWIDDVYITGILARALKIKHYDLQQFFTVHPEFLRCCIKDTTKLLDCEYLVGPNGGETNLFFDFNQAMKTCNFNKCNKRSKLMNETCVAERKSPDLGRGNGIITNYKLH